MKGKGKIILIVLITLAVSALTFASDRGIVKLQGVVMAVEMKKNIVTVNERSFVCGRHTIIYNEKGAPASLDRLKVSGWVYIEAVRERGTQRNIAEKIYIIPKYIDEEEKHLYPFIQ